MLFLFCTLCLFTGCARRGSVKMILEDVDTKGVKIIYWYQHTGHREESLQEMIGEFNKSNDWGLECSQGW